MNSRVRFASAALGTAALGLTVTAGSLTSPAAASPGQSVTSLAGGETPTALAQALVGTGVTISNVTYTGNNLAAGLFSGMSAVGISDGVALSSGAVATENNYTSSVLGPNNSDYNSATFGGPGDVDLDTLVLPENTYDAAVLEFDFVPNTTSITFNYVFGSDEYNESVNDYNDVFAFYVNGANCATVDNPAQPVSINTINADTNADLFRDNDPSDFTTPPIDTQMDGLTTVLTCQATVNRNQTNHIKLAIADTGDDIRNSDVFIAAGSLRANNPPVAHDDSYPATATTVTTAAPGVLANDTDPDGDALTVDTASVTQPTHGSVTVNTDGSFTYTRQAGYDGADSFTYAATDGGPDSTTATVSLTTAPAVTTKDTTAPDTLLTKAPRKKMHKKQAHFRFSSTEAGSTFLCKLDDQKFNTCTSAVVEKFSPGKHTFTVEAIDQAGNVDATPATVSWRFIPIRDDQNKQHHAR